MLNPMEPTTAAVLAAMHFVRDDPSLRAESVKTAGLVRIDRGAYLDPSLLPITAKPWEVDRTVTKARCHALARRTPSAHTRTSAPRSPASQSSTTGIKAPPAPARVL